MDSCSSVLCGTFPKKDDLTVVAREGHPRLADGMHDTKSQARFLGGS